VIFLFGVAIFQNALGDYNLSNENRTIKNKNCIGIVDRIEGEELIIECANKKMAYFPCKNLHELKEGDCVNINNNGIKVNIKLNRSRKYVMHKLYENAFLEK
jgi:hypothetical protein